MPAKYRKEDRESLKRFVFALLNKGKTDTRVITREVKKAGFRKPCGGLIDEKFMSNFRFRNNIGKNNGKLSDSGAPPSIISILEDPMVPGINKFRIMQAYFTHGLI